MPPTVLDAGNVTALRACGSVGDSDGKWERSFDGGTWRCLTPRPRPGATSPWPKYSPLPSSIAVSCNESSQASI